MPGSIRVARLLGIDLRIHLSWLFIFALVMIGLTESFPRDYPIWSDETIVVIAAISALLFFASVVAHELAHAVVARAFRMEVSSITLFLLGGVANLTKEPPSARAELLTAVAGPATSLVIGGMGLLVQLLARNAGLQPVEAIAGYLGPVNIALAIFNMLPGFPLDGGRVLRAAIWGLRGDRGLATRLAARGGQLLAAMLVVGGAYFVFRLQDTFGAWYFLIAYFLWNAASTALAQEQVNDAFGEARVRDVMTTDYSSALPDDTLGAVVRDVMLKHNLRVVPVVSAGRCVGIIGTDELRSIDHERWSRTTVGSVMRSAETFDSIRPNDLLAIASEKFRATGQPLLPVVHGEALMGFLSAEALEVYVHERERERTGRAAR